MVVVKTLARRSTSEPDRDKMGDEMVETRIRLRDNFDRARYQGGYFRASDRYLHSNIARIKSEVAKRKQRIQNRKSEENIIRLLGKDVKPESGFTFKEISDENHNDLKLPETLKISDKRDFHPNIH